MKTKLNEVKSALTRKAGPLPVWAWALIAGAAIYVYRVRGGLVGGSGSSGSATDTSTSPGVADATGGAGSASPGSPVTLQPGESVYDPATGKVTGTSPDQQAGNSGGGSPDMTTPMDPISLMPGESVYDPNTHQLVTGSNNNNNAKGKRKPKAKKQHGKTGKVAHPGHGNKRKPRSVAKITNPLHRKHKNEPPKGRARGNGGAAAPKGAPRTRAHTAPSGKPVVKQHSVAPKIVHPTTQKVAPHPAAPAPAHRTAPVAHAAPRPAPKPKPRKR